MACEICGPTANGITRLDHNDALRLPWQKLQDLNLPLRKTRHAPILGDWRVARSHLLELVRSSALL
jgi:hypothetical protein